MTICLADSELAHLFRSALLQAAVGMPAEDVALVKQVAKDTLRTCQLELALRPKYRPGGPLERQIRRAAVLAWIRRNLEKLVQFLKDNWRLVLQLCIGLIFIVL